MSDSSEFISVALGNELFTCEKALPLQRTLYTSLDLWAYKECREMAKLNDSIDTDDGFPELSIPLRKPGEAGVKCPSKTPMTGLGSGSSPRKERIRDGPDASHNARSISKGNGHEKRISKQRPLGNLKLSNINSLLSKANDQLNARGYNDLGTECFPEDQKFRSNPKRLAKATVDYSKFASRLSDACLSFPEDDESFTDLSGFVAPDSASDDEILPPKSPRKRNAQPFLRKDVVPKENTTFVPRKSPPKSRKKSGIIDMTTPKKNASSVICPKSPPDCQIPCRKSDPIGGISNIDEPFSRLRS